MPRNVTLPDGRVLVIPDDATPDQLAALRNQLASKYADLKTGAGMDAAAVQQSRASLARGVQPNYTMEAATAPKLGLESGLPSPAQDAQTASTMAKGAGIGSLAGGGIAAPLATLRALLGGVTGSWAGGHAGKYLAGESGEGIGKTVGGLAGAGAGAAGMNLMRGGSLWDLLSPQAVSTESEPAFVPMSQSPNADEYAAIRAAQRASLRTQAAGAGVPGSAVQEAGWQPAVTRVPIRPEPSSPLNAPQVPGPDSSGRGNILTPLARRGDPRAAAELTRRGRTVLYVPSDEYADPREVIKFDDSPTQSSLVDLLRSLRRPD